ncbi:MAG: FimV/HubP family polar landmark protein, partial [Gammaproteobacteria bacterium]
TKTASAGAEKKLQIMGAETKAGQPVTVAGGSDVADLQKQAAQAKEALESQKQKNAELQSRIDELQGLLQKKERLINLQSDQLSELQKSMSEKKKEGAEQPPAVTPEKPVTGQVGTTSGEPPSTEAGTEKPSAPAPEAPAAEKPAPAPAETPAPSETPAPATSESPAAQTEPKTPESPEPPKTEASSSPASKPAEPQSVPKPKVTPPPEQPGFFDSILSNPTMMMGAGGGLLLVLALVWLVIRRSGQRRAAAAAATPSFAEPDIDDDVAIPDELESLTPADVAEAEGEPEPEPQAAKAVEDELEHTTVMPPPGGAAAEEITNDEVMNEADVYLAYGLTDQAVDMLKDAISKHPERNDYRLKLLEAYYNAKDKANFDTTARALNDSLGGAKGQIWDRAVAMGKEISPESALFSGETTSLSVDDFTAKKPEAADIELGGEEEFEPPTSGGGFEGEFDLPEIGGEPSLDEGDDQTVALEPEFEPESDTGLGMPDLDALGNEPAQAEESYEQPATETDINELEFDLGDLDLPSEEPTLTGQEPESDTTGLDFDVNDLDISGDELSELETAPEAGAGSDTASNEDALDIEMDNLDMGEDFGVDSDTATVEMPAGEEDSLTEEVGTKLDLAKAYIDMGDEDGARGALEEVLAEGNDAQKREAQDLMSQIA